MKSIQIITIPTVNINIQIDHFKTTIPHPQFTSNIQIHSNQNNIHVSTVHRGSAVRFSQALPGFRITSHHLYASLMYQYTSNIQIHSNQNNIHVSRVHRGSAARFSQALPGFCIASHHVSNVIELLGVWQYNKPKTKNQWAQQHA